MDRFALSDMGRVLQSAARIVNPGRICPLWPGENLAL